MLASPTPVTRFRNLRAQTSSCRRPNSFTASRHSRSSSPLSKVPTDEANQTNATREGGSLEIPPPGFKDHMKHPRKIIIFNTYLGFGSGDMLVCSVDMLLPWLSCPKNLDPMGRILSATKSFCVLFGIPKKELWLQGDFHFHPWKRTCPQKGTTKIVGNTSSNRWFSGGHVKLPGV